MDQEKINAFNEEQKRQAEKKKQEQDRLAQLSASEKIAQAVGKSTETTKALDRTTKSVKVTNPDLAKTKDIGDLVSSINELNLTTFMASSGGISGITDNLTALAQSMGDLNDKFRQQGIDSLSKQLDPLVKRLEDVSSQLKNTKLKVDDTVTSTVANAFKDLQKTVNSIDWQPQITVPKTDVKVAAPDLKALIDPMKKVEKAIDNIEIPDNSVDLSPIVAGLKTVQDAINGLRFPAPNYVLPFTTDVGKATQVKLSSTGALPVDVGSTNVTLTTSDIEIGAVELKNSSDDTRAIVTASNALKVDGSAVTQPVSGTIAASNFPTTVDTNSGTKSASTLRVVLATDQPALTNKLLVTPDSVALPANQSVNVSQINGVTPLMGAGNTGTGSARVTIASDQAVIPISDNSGSLTVDAPVGTPVFATVTPSATGGWSTFMASSSDGSTALTNAAQAIKGSAGTFGGYYIYNPNTSAIYVHIYNVASGSVTVGTTNPQNTFCLPPASAANLEITNGINYSTAMSCAATTTGGGATAPTTALEANFLYK